MRDERHVAARAIRAAAALDYPRLEIQVLDDSTDDTAAIVDATAREVGAIVVRRPAPDFSTASALAHGLATARGELIALFDGDFEPPREFLRRLVPALVADPRLAMVQASWDYRDRDANALTRAEAVMLDGLMQVEQAAKAARHVPVPFNGSAGVWRRAAIDDAGGWRAATLTEDLDLSCRAAARGWRSLHLAGVVVPTELPATLRAFRLQQRRWTRGSAQVLRACGAAIWRAPLPLSHRASLLLRAGTRAIYPLLAILTLTMPITTFTDAHTLVEYDPAMNVATVALAVVALALFYALGQRRAGRPGWRGVASVPVICALHVGLSAVLACELVAGLVTRGGAFARTPKRGDAAAGTYAAPFDRFALVELAIGVAYAGFAIVAATWALPATAAFFAAWSAAHVYTGAGSLRA